MLKYENCQLKIKKNVDAEQMSKELGMHILALERIGLSSCHRHSKATASFHIPFAVILAFQKTSRDLETRSQCSLGVYLCEHHDASSPPTYPKEASSTTAS